MRFLCVLVAIYYLFKYILKLIIYIFKNQHVQ